MNNPHTLPKADLQDFIRSHGVGWPLGYPQALLMADGQVLDVKCAKNNYRQIRRASTNHDCHDYHHDPKDCWKAEAVFVHWEGEPLRCAHCNSTIPSAYGDPDDNDEQE